MDEMQARYCDSDGIAAAEDDIISRDEEAAQPISVEDVNAISSVEEVMIANTPMFDDEDKDQPVTDTADPNVAVSSTPLDNIIFNEDTLKAENTDDKIEGGAPATCIENENHVDHPNWDVPQSSDRYFDDSKAPPLDDVKADFGGGWLDKLRRRRPKKGGSSQTPSGDQVAADNQNNFLAGDTPQDVTTSGISLATTEANGGDGVVKGEINLPEDSFSMFWCADNVMMHILPLVVYCIQIWILYLLFQSMRSQPEGSSVDLSAKVVATIVSVFSAGDFIDGLLLMGGPVGRKGSRRAPGYSAKWELINILRLSEGIFLVAVSFMFVAQSYSVVDLFQNFAAVSSLCTNLCDAWYLQAFSPACPAHVFPWFYLFRLHLLASWTSEFGLSV